MKTTAAILSQWRHQDPDRLLQTALQQPQRLAGMSPELQPLGAENAWLSQCAETSARSLSDVSSNKKSAILLTAVSGELFRNWWWKLLSGNEFQIK
jgi:hypothetical protein